MNTVGISITKIGEKMRNLGKVISWKFYEFKWASHDFLMGRNRSSSGPVNLLDKDFSGCKAKKLESDPDANAIVYWCEWKLSPTENISHGGKTEWCRYMHQRVLFTGDIQKGQEVKLHCHHNGDDRVVLKADIK